MTQFPPLPRGRRNLDDLDALIDASIGQSEVGQDQRHGSTTSVSPIQVDRERPQAASHPGAGPERFRVMIDPAVIVATKHLALERKVAPSEIVELALRQYLNLET
ncbi:UNVERIFIED_ORG: hypothetical protein J2W66_004360 [Agrobacterium larrymoorei]|uniref:Uncharacterized protein n=2 Tax=Rhizobium/Agrobacterium group TaxID=227290 RepID=A0AA92BZU8_RHIRH|nr:MULTISPECIES: CopG family transcriptional regulator [Rhizobium/Agrobacterium group]MDP9573857.1 hypothetical protein [Agrobacterium larrymoorei]PVE62558.1 hypothetical protein DC415_21570 [Agrobacterium tumefaciens]PVE70696.1 hypothetical protein DCP16_21570 [Sphingomonas sp. TPD3009]PVE50181.1 hypothetical protein DC430_22645 [Rhizobium rhizogenes]TBN14840.1 hypothetical protein EYC79_07360 [Agrobacterium cavarae]